jgi:hypothetical protein
MRFTHVAGTHLLRRRGFRTAAARTGLLPVLTASASGVAAATAQVPEPSMGGKTLGPQFLAVKRTRWVTLSIFTTMDLDSLKTSRKRHGASYGGGSIPRRVPPGALGCAPRGYPPTRTLGKVNVGFYGGRIPESESLGRGSKCRRWGAGPSIANREPPFHRRGGLPTAPCPQPPLPQNQMAPRTGWRVAVPLAGTVD